MKEGIEDEGNNERIGEMRMDRKKQELEDGNWKRSSEQRKKIREMQKKMNLKIKRVKKSEFMTREVIKIRKREDR